MSENKSEFDSESFNLHTLLTGFEKICCRLQARVESGHTHRRIEDTSLDVLVTDLIAQNLVDIDSGELSSEAEFKPTEEMSINYLYHQGDLMRLIAQIEFVRTISMVQLLQGFLACIGIGNLLVSFICCRSIIETVAIFEEALQALHGIPESTSYELIRTRNAQLIDKLSNNIFGQRVDWKTLSANPLLIRTNEIKYSKKPLHIDLTAPQILNLIDRLGKKVNGARGAYEVLCEFAHPNVGVMLASVQSTQKIIDGQSITWIEQTLGLTAPKGFFDGDSRIFSELIRIVFDCSEYFEKILVDEFPSVQQRALKICQILARNVLEQSAVEDAVRFTRLKKVLNPYATCPCLSGKKIKFCCGKSL